MGYCIEEVKGFYRYSEGFSDSQPPVDPDSLEAELRAGAADGSISFSYMEDLQPVIDLYRRTFVDAFANYRVINPPQYQNLALINFENLGWGSPEAAVLVKTIEWIASMARSQRVDR